MQKIISLQLNFFITLIFVFCFSLHVFSEETCEVKNCDLKLRLELGSSFRIAHNSNDADGVLISSSVDIGKELSPRTTLSLRLLPVFGYIQEGNIEDIIGFGAGAALRIYFKKNQEKGFFTEIHEVVCIHENKFEENDSNINFYSAIGIGYQLCPNWDMLLRFGHISNADIKAVSYTHLTLPTIYSV